MEKHFMYVCICWPKTERRAAAEQTAAVRAQLARQALAEALDERHPLAEALVRMQGCGQQGALWPRRQPARPTSRSPNGSLATSPRLSSRTNRGRSTVPPTRRLNPTSRLTRPPSRTTRCRGRPATNQQRATKRTWAPESLKASRGTGGKTRTLGNGNGHKIPQVPA